MIESDADIAAEYLAVVERMLEAESVLALGLEYQARLQNETRGLSEKLFLVLDKIFADVDVTTDNAELVADRPDMFIGREELQSLLLQSAAKLRHIALRANSSGEPT